MNIRLGQFELHPASSEINSEALLIQRAWNEKGQLSLSPPEQLFPMQGNCSPGYNASQVLSAELLFYIQQSLLEGQDLS